MKPQSVYPRIGYTTIRCATHLVLLRLGHFGLNRRDLLYGRHLVSTVAGAGLSSCVGM